MKYLNAHMKSQKFSCIMHVSYAATSVSAQQQTISNHSQQKAKKTKLNWRTSTCFLTSAVCVNSSLT